MPFPPTLAASRRGFQVALVSLLALAACALAGVARADGPTPRTADPAQPVYDWGICYYMSYDNNLERCGAPILDMIRNGITKGNVVAAVQADFTDRDGMRRYSVTAGGVEEKRIRSEDSADEADVVAYLRWFASTFRCKRYVFTFLDHGGRLDEMCADEHPGKSGQEWMSGRALGEKLRAFRPALPGKWELLFLQQCGRGSMENLYSFRGTADYLMSSPVPVGAPNTYYTALHEWLAANPEATGDAVAAKIADEDRDYTIYTCLRTARLEELPRRLDAALAPLLACKKLAPPARRPRVIHPVGEPIYDARAWLAALAAANGVGADEVAAFFRWTRSELFTMVRVAPGQGPSTERLCGLSTFGPADADEAGRYAGLDLPAGSRLGDLWKALGVKTEPRP
ncbi:MAG: hypothetical protein HYZ53_07065 [Planctomycetes bacterium]|nr:hypothetical protein [Planctomycetota bacterium]